MTINNGGTEEYDDENDGNDDNDNDSEDEEGKVEWIIIKKMNCYSPLHVGLPPSCKCSKFSDLNEYIKWEYMMELITPHRPLINKCMLCTFQRQRAIFICSLLCFGVRLNDVKSTVCPLSPHPSIQKRIFRQTMRVLYVSRYDRYYYAIRSISLYYWHQSNWNNRKAKRILSGNKK